MECGAIIRCSDRRGRTRWHKTWGVPKTSPSKEKDRAASVIALTGDSWELLPSMDGGRPSQTFGGGPPRERRIGNFGAGKGILVTSVETWVLAKRTTPPAWHSPTREERATFLMVIPPPPLCVPQKNIINLYICIRKIYKYSI